MDSRQKQIARDYDKQIRWESKYFFGTKEQQQKALSILKQLKKQELAMSQDEIMAYAQKIRPVVRGSEFYVGVYASDLDYCRNNVSFLTDGEFKLRLLRHIQCVKEHGTALFWAKNAPIHSESFTYSNNEPFMPAFGLTEVARVKTYHRYGGYYACLRPSVDECIYQCPKDILDKVCAVEVKSAYPADVTPYYSAIDRHELVTIYYSGKVPQEVLAQEIKW